MDDTIKTALHSIYRLISRLNHVPSLLLCHPSWGIDCSGGALYTGALRFVGRLIAICLDTTNSNRLANAAVVSKVFDGLPQCTLCGETMETWRGLSSEDGM